MVHTIKVTSRCPHPPRSAGTDSAIVAIIAEYKRRFGQESVLRVVTAGRASS